jgi:bacterioferritin-associated ferredoxin
MYICLCNAITERQIIQAAEGAPARRTTSRTGWASG